MEEACIELETTLGSLREAPGRAREALGSAARFVRMLGWEGLWVYLGSRRDYFIVEGIYCSCPSFSSNLRRGRPGCKHLAWLAEIVETEKYRVAEVPLDELASTIGEIFGVGLAVTVRRRIASRSIE